MMYRNTQDAERPKPNGGSQRKTEKRREARRLGCSVSELERSGSVLYVKGTSTRAEDVSSVAEARDRARAAEEAAIRSASRMARVTPLTFEIW